MGHDDKMMAQTAIIKQHTCITLDDAYKKYGMTHACIVRIPTPTILVMIISHIMSHNM